MSFLVRMPVGAAAQLYRHSGDLIGWLEKVRGGRFAGGGFAEAFADGALQNPVPGGNVDRHGAAEAVVQSSPDYVVHDSLWQEGSPPERPAAATPELHEAVRLRVEDPGSGADPVLKRRKLDHFHCALSRSVAKGRRLLKLVGLMGVQASLVNTSPASWWRSPSIVISSVWRARCPRSAKNVESLYWNNANPRRRGSVAHRQKKRAKS